MSWSFPGNRTNVLANLSASPLANGPASISYWMRRDNLRANDDYPITLRGGVTEGDPYFALQPSTDFESNTPTYQVRESDFVTAQATAGFSRTGVWGHLVGGHDAASGLTNAKVFFDGANKGTDSATQNDSTDAVVTAIGADTHGDICEIAVWGAYLSDDEMISLSEGISPLLVRPSALAAYWPARKATTADYRDVVSGFPVTPVVGGPSTADHYPGVIYPRHPHTGNLRPLLMEGFSAVMLASMIVKLDDPHEVTRRNLAKHILNPFNREDLG